MVLVPRLRLGMRHEEALPPFATQSHVIIRAEPRGMGSQAEPGNQSKTLANG
jgi:hypothetical protein